MGLSPQQIDAIIEQHFNFEATDDVDGVVATLADAVEHYVVPSPMGVLDNRDAIRRFYEMLFSDIKGEGITPIRRLYGEDFVVDEVFWKGHIHNGRSFLCDGRSGPAEFRMLHVFEFKDGRIASEKVWCDLAAIQRQLGCAPC